MTSSQPPQISLPKSWPKHVRSALLHVIALAQYATTYTRSWAVDGMNARMRLKAENDRLLEQLAQQREETRIKDARMARINPHRRPYYPPTERMAILELRAARGWTLEQCGGPASFMLNGITLFWPFRPAAANYTSIIEHAAKSRMVVAHDTCREST